MTPRCAQKRLTSARPHSRAQPLTCARVDMAMCCCTNKKVLLGSTRGALQVRAGADQRHQATCQHQGSAGLELKAHDRNSVCLLCVSSQGRVLSASVEICACEHITRLLTASPIHCGIHDLRCPLLASSPHVSARQSRLHPKHLIYPPCLVRVSTCTLSKS